jgi:hypothetical protein
MKLSRWSYPAGISLAAFFLIALGCGPRDPADKPPDANKQDAAAAKEKKIEAARAKLSAEDRALVDEQDYCAVMTKQKLGSMGVPMKVMVKGQPVFLCCKGCKSEAEDDPDQTLKTVAELKAKKK